jgi:phosphatidylinositol glycan class U
MITIFPEVFPCASLFFLPTVPSNNRAEDLRHPLITTILHIHASLLMPLFHSLWLKQGTGNANFFYASTLVFACANGAALIDCVWAGLRLALGPRSEKYVIIQE